MDWSKFKVRIGVKAPVDKLYHGWATRAGIEHWFLRYCEYRNADGSVKGKEEYVKKRKGILMPGAGMVILIQQKKKERYWKPMEKIFSNSVLAPRVFVPLRSKKRKVKHL